MTIAAPLPMFSAMKARKNPEFTDEEIDRRALEMVQRGFELPHKPLKKFVGKTPRAKAMARKRKAKGPKSP